LCEGGLGGVGGLDVVVLAWPTEAGARYAYGFNRYGCVFVFVNVFVFLIDWVWILCGCRIFYFFVFFIRGVGVIVDADNVAVCLFYQAIYFGDVGFEIDFALLTEL
jgi:hypothetical protein